MFVNSVSMRSLLLILADFAGLSYGSVDECVVFSKETVSLALEGSDVHVWHIPGTLQ